MKNYLVYKEDPGPFIKKISSSSEKKLLLNVSESENWVECDYSTKNYYIKEGIPKKYPKKPEYPCKFDYESEIWIAEQELCWVELRKKRDMLLLESDWTQAPDSPVEKNTWAEYRKRLRNLPQNTTDPTDVIWPEKPKK